MSQKAHDVLKAMKELETDNKKYLTETFVQIQVTKKFAELLVILSEEQAASAATLELFTYVLVFFTIALFIVGVIQIILMLCGH